MKKNIIVLFGVNGVGKSSVSRLLCEEIGDSVTLSGSELLIRSFKGLGRDQLELLSPEEKMRMLEPAFLGAFQRSRHATRIILDTHLVVPIRKNGRLVLENVWPGAFTPCVERAFLLVSDPKEILQRRKRDADQTGRVRELDAEHIRTDQEINSSVFAETFTAAGVPHVVHNAESRMKETVTSILLCLAREA